MTEAQVIEGLNGIFRDVFLRDINLTPALTAKDVDGWDSMKQIEIVLAAEEKFKVKFITKELDSLENVGALIKLILAKAA